SAATAACMAIDDGSSVQKVPYAKLRERLLADKQMLEWTGPKKAVAPAAAVADLSKLPGIVADDAAAEKTGEWKPGNNGSHVGPGYEHDENDGKGAKSARFKLAVKEAGKYQVRLAYPPNANRATNVPVTVSGQAGGPATAKVNQRKAPSVDKLWEPVGTYEFAAGATAVVEVSNAGTDGYVIIDAVQLLPVK
ncbi:MAG TPA: hypothetical protein VF796_02765, partial [Humisphaera sp.]